MPTQVFRNLGIASILGVGIAFSASPAKAISYSFSGTSTFACSDPGFGDSCQVTFSDFTVDWDGTNWSFDDPSFFHTLTITNTTNGGSFVINTSGGSILAGSNQNFIGFSNGSSQVAFSFSSPAPSPAVANNLLTLQSIDINAADAKFDTDNFATLSPSAQAYAAPYFASVLSVIPMLAASRRIKRRILSA